MVVRGRGKTVITQLHADLMTINYWMMLMIVSDLVFQCLHLVRIYMTSPQVDDFHCLGAIQVNTPTPSRSLADNSYSSVFLSLWYIANTITDLTLGSLVNRIC